MLGQIETRAIVPGSAGQDNGPDALGGAAKNASSASSSSSHMALRLAGRFIVRVATGPSVVTTSMSLELVILILAF
jgi:hypothetical protein